MLLAAATAALALNGASPNGNLSGSFETKLSPEQRIRQALNRLTFGARPGDIEEVRKLGVEKWIELQLHPERITENPFLEIRLKPLDTLRMDRPPILKLYFPAIPPRLVQPVRIERVAARRTVPQGLQRHRRGTPEGHHGA